jgi:hypothetical protein
MVLSHGVLPTRQHEARGHYVPLRNKGAPSAFIRFQVLLAFQLSPAGCIGDT